MWPSLAECVKATDWSWYQNLGPDHDHRPQDAEAFVEQNPEVDLYIIRAVWPNGAPDKHFPYYYDTFYDAGKRVAVYLWPNPTKSIPTTIENWKRALDGRDPPLMVEDYELKWFKQAAELTANARGTLSAAQQEWPLAWHMPYSRGYWWDANMLHGWEQDYKFWLAHYPYFTYNPRLGKWVQASNFAEVDYKLPISNNFTPYMGKTIQPNQVVGWQLSEKGVFAPLTCKLDFGYWKKAFVDQAFNYDVPIPEPCIVRLEAQQATSIFVAAPENVEVIRV